MQAAVAWLDLQQWGKASSRAAEVASKPLGAGGLAASVCPLVQLAEGHLMLRLAA